MRRVGVAGMWHETNTYSGRATTLADFEAFELVAGEAIVERHRDVGSVIGGFLDAPGVAFVPVFSAAAWPAGPAGRATADELLGRLHDHLAAAAPLDGVLLNLHGAMVAQGHPDMDHDAVAVVRDVVGDVPLAAVLDYHANPSPSLAGHCQVVLAYDTYPHVDMRDRGREAALLMRDMLDGRRLATLLRKQPLLSSPLAQATDAEPMRGLQARARRRAKQAELVRVSLLPGFAYGDVARAGFSVLVVHDEQRRAQATHVGQAIVEDIEQHAASFDLSRDGPTAAVSRALTSRSCPVVLVDVADNVGGGSAGDGTALLAELLRQGAEGAVVTLADEEVAAEAQRLGPDATIEADVGGKTDRLHGDPVPIRGRIERITDGRYRSGGSWMTGRQFEMGTTAVIQVRGVTLVVTSRPVPPFHAEQLASAGIEAAAMRVIVAKGAVAWRAAYGDVAATVIEVDTPGVCPVDPRALARTTTPMTV